MNNVTNAGTEAGIVEAQTASNSSPVSEARFEDLGLGPDVLKAVADSGYTKPTPIQAQGIPHVLQRRDIIGIAQTGTGKTASFTLPMIEMLSRGRAKARMPRTLILEPTRELAAQVAESFERYGKYHKLTMALLIGGVSYDDQDKKLDRGVDVLIATPGRLLDHFERGKLMLNQVQILVIDEADRMLDMGFIPDVERICKMIPFTRQTLFYSATMPPEIQRLTNQFLHNPVRVEVSRPATTADGITQIAISIPGTDWSKREALRQLIRATNVKNAIVFCNRKRDVDVVAKSLKKHGFSAAPLHGDLDQSVRTKTLDGFRNGEILFLVASDVAARGLDIPAVSHIFNFDVPFQPDDYVHRIGRTGRAGLKGHAIMLVDRHDEEYVGPIEKLIGQPITRQTIELPPEREGEHSSRGHHDHKRDGRRGGRGRGRGHTAPSHKSHSQPRHETPKPAHAQQTAKPAHAPQAAPAPRQEHKQQQPQQHHAKNPAPASNGAAKKPDAHELPAFLLRPVPLPKPATKKSDVDA